MKTEKDLKTGIELIKKERQEQIEKHQVPLSWDVQNNSTNQLSIGACFLAIPDNQGCGNYEIDCPEGWNVEKFEYMMQKSYKKKLIIAGALIAVEIDRLTILENE